MSGPKGGMLVLQNLLLLITVLTVYVLRDHVSVEDQIFVAVGIACICGFRIVFPLLTGRLFDSVKTDYEEGPTRELCRRKFTGHMNKLTLHTLFQVWGVYVLMQEEWFSLFDCHKLWDGWDPDAAHVGGCFRAYYLTELAFFLASIVMQFVEPKSHDHVAMLAHHIGAAVLVAMSYAYNTHRIGAMVLVTREGSDVLVHLARGLGLLQFRKMSEGVLVMVTLNWFFSRILYYPLMPVWSALQSPTYEWHYPMYLLYCILLVALIPLDFYYMGLALSAIMRRIRNPNLKNIDPDNPAFQKSPKNKKEQ